ncbi:hypothetical protein V8E51_012972 [Hyaloscypha variabilis]
MSRLQNLLSTLPRLTLPPHESASILYEFLLFPKLPPELRNKIWEHAAHVPRVVKVICHMREIHLEEIDRGSWNSNVEGQTRHPGIMQACRESRVEGGRYYDLVHENVVPTFKYLNGRSRPANLVADVISNTLYINFRVDRFVIPSGVDRLGSLLRLGPNFDQHTYNFNYSTLQRIRYLECNLRGTDNMQHYFLYRFALYLSGHESDLQSITFCGEDITALSNHFQEDHGDSIAGRLSARSVQETETWFRKELEEYLSDNKQVALKAPVRIRVMPADNIKLYPCSANE